MNPFQTESFKRLRAHWYQRLKDSGFEDIEADEDAAGSPRLKVWHSSHFQKPSRHPERFEERRDYFILATHFLESFQFETHLQRRIWTFHAHGFSLRAIGQFVGKDKDHVHGVVRRLKAQMIQPQYESD
jgi:hypothetical protein